MNMIKSAIAVTAIAALPQIAAANEAWTFPQVELDRVSLSPKLSTLGFGLEAKYQIDPHFDIVASINKLNLDRKDIGGIDGAVIDAEVDFFSYGVGVDVRPFEALGLTVGLGVLKNDNEITASGVGTSAVEIGGVSFAPDQVGRIDADVKFKTFAPYVTVGYNKSITENFAVGASIGALFQGKADLDFRAVANDPTLQATLDQAVASERAQIEDDLDDAKILPILSLSMTYRF